MKEQLLRLLVARLLIIFLYFNCSAIGQVRTELLKDPSSNKGTLKVYNGQNLLFQSTTVGLSAVRQQKISPDGNWLLAITEQGYVQLWDIRRGKRVKTFLSPIPRPLGADFTPDSQNILLSFWGEADKFLDDTEFQKQLQSSFWSIVPLERLNSLTVYKKDSRYSGKVHFSKSGKRMIFSSLNPSGGDPATIYNAKTGKLITVLPRLLYSEGSAQRGGAGSVDARLSSDGNRSLVYYSDQRLAEYNVNTGSIIKILGPLQNVEEINKYLDEFEER